MSPRFAQLGDVATFTNGVAFAVSDWADTGARIIRIQNLTDPGKSYNRTMRSVSSRFHVQPGDLLVSWSATLGVFEWKGPDTAVLNQHIFRVEPDRERVDKGYLRHALAHILTRAERHLHGATMKHVNKKDLLSSEFFAPSVGEQKRIANVLDQVDDLRAKRRRAIAALDDLARSVFLDMFGDPVSNSRGWERVKMGDFLAGIESGKSPQCLDRPAEGEEWGVLKLGAVTRCAYLQDENKALPPGAVPDTRQEVRAGDLLFTRKNTPGLVAASAYVRSTRSRLLMPDLIFRLVPADRAPIDKVYLHALLTHSGKRRKLQELASGSAASMVNISKSKLLEFECEIPPLDLQQSFARRIEAIEAEKRAHRAHLVVLDELFVSLQQRAFTGALWNHEASGEAA
ncbi:restriction endonuclease subunit S [Streptomyces sp. NPDC002690]